MKSSLKEGIKLIADAISATAGGVHIKTASTTVDTTASCFSVIEQMCSVNETTERLMKCKAFSLSCDDVESERSQKRLKITDDAIDQAFEMLEKLNKKRGVSN